MMGVGVPTCSEVCSISKTPHLLNTLFTLLKSLDAPQVGFKRISRSNLCNLMRTFSRDFFLFKLGLYPFFHFFSLFCIFSCLTHPSKLIMRKKVRPSDGQVVSSTHQAKQKWLQVKSRLYLDVLLLQGSNYCCYCPAHHSPLLPYVLLPHLHTSARSTVPPCSASSARSSAWWSSTSTASWHNHLTTMTTGRCIRRTQCSAASSGSGLTKSSNVTYESMLASPGAGVEGVAYHTQVMLSAVWDCSRVCVVMLSYIISGKSDVI